MTIPKFYDKFTMKAVREDSLNKTIDAVNALDPKVKGLQEVVALTMTEPDVDINAKKITFKRGGEVADAIDLGPLLDSFKHGIDTVGERGGDFTDVQKLKFKNSTLTQSGDEVIVDMANVQGQINSGGTRGLNYIRITGNTAGSSLDNAGLMTLNMPSSGPTITGQVKNGDVLPITKVKVVGHAEHSTLTDDTLSIDIPDPITGAIQGEEYKQLNEILVTGAVGTSNTGGGRLTIDLVSLSGDIGDGSEYIKGVKLVGNKGASKIENEILEIELPTGGSGGGTELKVGAKGFPAIPTVSEIWFDGSEVKVDNTKSTNKVLVTPKGFLVQKETEDAKYIKQIKLTGDVEHSTVSDTGLLELNIPIHQGITVSDGKTVVTAAEGLSFPNATVTTDSASSTPQAVITFDGTKGTMSGKSAALTELIVKGNLGTSNFDSGVMTLDLPAGGGGTGGADITGVVGSTAAKIERIEVTGEVANSSVTESTKTLKIDIPRKVGIKGGADTYSDIDIVEVANSTVQLDSAGGKRKAFITPQIPFMFYGWFQDMTSLNNAIPSGGRIPTKTCAYVPDPVTRQNTLWMWLPNAGTGISDWVAMPTTGSLALVDRNHSTHGILGVQKNPMIEVDDKGLLTVKDTTIAEITVDVLDEVDTGILHNGLFKKVKFNDGDGTVDFDLTNHELSICRAQRRKDMGLIPDTAHPEYMASKYEGSIWLNKADHAWWGYDNESTASPKQRWTKIIHRGMSDEVTDLSTRIPGTIPQVDKVDAGGDSPMWLHSGWTGVQKDTPGILPPLAQGTTGMVIQTFAGPYGSPAQIGRIQIGYLGSDAAVYKRFRNADDVKWSEWVKVSFNPGDLAEHNGNPASHQLTHPFYQVFGMGAKYPDLAGAGKGDFKHVMEHEREAGLIASSGSPYARDSTGVKVPYDSKYHIRGLAYIGGKSDIANKTVRGDWYVDLQECKSSSSIFNTIYTKKYQHHSETLKYPPFSFDFYGVSLERGDYLRLKIRFVPEKGTEATFMASFPDLWIMPGRSFFSVDVEGQDTGYCIGKNMGRFHGGFSQLGGGAFGMQEGEWPNDKGIIVGDGIETAVEAG